ncbi:MAG: hypothetical protein JST23_04370 [Bacteroidetes bacterium]|nr:hypothetical protein [Bacteroidota bacterium]
MKRRLRKVVNFFAFNLLFFALYLNFIHKDKAQVAVSHQSVQTPAFSEAATASVNAAENQTQATNNNAPANIAVLKLSVN